MILAICNSVVICSQIIGRKEKTFIEGKYNIYLALIVSILLAICLSCLIYIETENIMISLMVLIIICAVEVRVFIKNYKYKIAKRR